MQDSILDVSSVSVAVSQSILEKPAKIAKLRSWYCQDWSVSRVCPRKKCKWAHGVDEMIPIRVDALYKEGRCKLGKNAEGCRWGKSCKHLHSTESLKGITGLGEGVLGLFDGNGNLMRMFIRDYEMGGKQRIPKEEVSIATLQRQENLALKGLSFSEADMDLDTEVESSLTAEARSGPFGYFSVLAESA